MAKQKSNIVRYKTKIHVIILLEMYLLRFSNDWTPKRTVSIKHTVLKIFQKFLLKVLYHLKLESSKPLTYSSYNRNNKVLTLVYLIVDLGISWIDRLNDFWHFLYRWKYQYMVLLSFEHLQKINIFPKSGGRSSKIVPATSISILSF